MDNEWPQVIHPNKSNKKYIYFGHFLGVCKADSSHKCQEDTLKITAFTGKKDSSWEESLV